MSSWKVLIGMVAMMVMIMTAAAVIIPSTDASVSEVMEYEVTSDTDIEQTFVHSTNASVDAGDVRVVWDENELWLEARGIGAGATLCIRTYGWDGESSDTPSVLILDRTAYVGDDWLRVQYTTYQLQPGTIEFTVWLGYSGGDQVTVWGSLDFTLDCESTMYYDYYTAISFDANSGVESSLPGTVEDETRSDSPLLDPMELTLPETRPTHSDSSMTFVGWATTSGGSAVYQPNSTVEMDPGAEITLYAVWEGATITVTFMDGDTEYHAVSMASGSPMAFPDDPTRSGHVFRGWFVDPGCQEKVQASLRPTEDITLYAGWVEELVFDTQPSASINVTEVDGYDRTYIFDASDSFGFTEVLWDFGDGTTSDQLYATHTYAEDGEYTVTLTVYGAEGEVSTSYDIDTARSNDDGDGFPWAIMVAAVIVVAVIAVVMLRFVL